VLSNDVGQIVLTIAMDILTIAMDVIAIKPKVNRT